VTIKTLEMNNWWDCLMSERKCGFNDPYHSRRRECVPYAAFGGSQRAEIASLSKSIEGLLKSLNLNGIAQPGSGFRGPRSARSSPDQYQTVYIRHLQLGLRRCAGSRDSVRLAILIGPPTPNLHRRWGAHRVLHPTAASKGRPQSPLPNKSIPFLVESETTPFGRKHPCVAG